MSTRKYRNIAVTGGAGFIGSNYIHYVYNKYKHYNIYNIDFLTYAGNSDNLRDIIEMEKRSNTSKRYHFIKADISDVISMEKIVQKTSFDAIINFAAESHVDRSIMNSDDFIKTNIAGVHTLIELVRKYDVPLYIQISTDEIYGDILSGSSTEKDPLKPSNPYAASKAAADLLVQSFVRTHGLPAIIVRGSNNFGRFQYPEKLIPLAITNIYEGKTVPMHGDGTQVRSWLHVEDFCSAIDLAMHRAEYGSIYNVGGTCRQNKTIIKNICQLLGKNYRRCVQYIDDRPGGDRRYSPDCTKIQRELGWRANHSIDKDIRSVLQWYIDQKTWWQKIKRAKAYQYHYNRQLKSQYY